MFSVLRDQGPLSSRPSSLPPASLWPASLWRAAVNAIAAPIMLFVALVIASASARADIAGPAKVIDGPAKVIAGPAKVIDGDTIEIAGERIRLHGIDAPESEQYCNLAEFQYPCGVMATAWLVERTLGREIRCEPRTRDRWERLVAICVVDGESLNELMVTSGWAVAFRRYSHDFEAQEAAARRERRGVWQGSFVYPVAWRRGDREARLYVFDEACPVKGNVTGKGEQIYHVEGGNHYDRLRLNPGQGDRCFQSISEAADAGFRPAGGK